MPPNMPFYSIVLDAHGRCQEELQNTTTVTSYSSWEITKNDSVATDLVIKDSGGVMAQWSNGLTSKNINPIIHYSITPVLHHSVVT